MSERKCPICLDEYHPGRCRRPGTKKYCGMCLNKLTEQVRKGPMLTFEGLQQAGVRSCAGWCVDCGCPVCAAHSREYKKDLKCATSERCDDRPPLEARRIQYLLDLYYPTWRTDGPTRCRVDGLPIGFLGFGDVCRRHYEQEKRNGKATKADKSPRDTLYVSFPPNTLKMMTLWAESEGMPTRRWIEGIVQVEIDRRVNQLLEITDEPAEIVEEGT